MNANDAFNLSMLTGRLWVYTREQSPGDTDLGFIHKEDIFEAIYTDDVFNVEFIKRRAEDRSFFLKEVLPITRIIQV